MEIPRIDGALVRITPDTTRPAPSLGLAVGQQVSARVVASGDGRATLELGGQRLEARTTVALAPGQLLQLQVAGLGAEIALRLMGGAAVSEQQFALAALAGAPRAGAGVAPDLGALLRALDAQPGADGGADVRARLTHLLGGLPAGAGGARLAAGVQDLLENSGLLFESRLRAWLQAQPRDAAATSALPPAVAADLKVLLGVVARALGLAASGDAGGAQPGVPRAPGADALRQQALQWLASAPQGEATAAGAEALRGVREAVLARQVDAAYHWVRDGTLAIDLPLLFGREQVLAHLRFRRGGSAGAGDGEAADRDVPRGVFLDFSVDPPGLGPVRAQVQVAGARVGLRLIVAGADLGTLVERELPSLCDALAEGGLAVARAEVLVDASRSRPEALPAPELPRGGSVLDVRA